MFSLLFSSIVHVLSIFVLGGKRWRSFYLFALKLTNKMVVYRRKTRLVTTKFWNAVITGAFSSSVVEW
jgi:hypothetical protein